jgi:hypothetical protein
MRRDATKRNKETRNSLESDGEHPPTSRTKGGSRGSTVKAAPHRGKSHGTRSQANASTDHRGAGGEREQGQEGDGSAGGAGGTHAGGGGKGGEQGGRNPMPAAPVVLVMLLLNTKSIVGKIDELVCVAGELSPDLIPY